MFLLMSSVRCCRRHLFAVWASSVAACCGSGDQFVGSYSGTWHAVLTASDDTKVGLDSSVDAAVYHSNDKDSAGKLILDFSVPDLQGKLEVVDCNSTSLSLAQFSGYELPPGAGVGEYVNYFSGGGSAKLDGATFTVSLVGGYSWGSRPSGSFQSTIITTKK